jgi:hypothetical protein
MHESAAVQPNPGIIFPVPPYFTFTMTRSDGFVPELRIPDWLGSLRLSRRGIQAAVIPSRSPYHVSFEATLGDLDRFHSQWTRNRHTLGCVLSRGHAQTGTQQFYWHADGRCISTCVHVVSWRANLPAFSVVGALSLRRPGARVTATLAGGNGPAAACIGVTAWRAIPPLRVARAKPFFWIDWKRQWAGGAVVRDVKCGLSVKMTNGLGFYCGTIGSTVGVAAEVESAWRFKVVLLRQGAGDMGVKVVLEERTVEQRPARRLIST